MKLHSETGLCSPSDGEVFFGGTKPYLKLYCEDHIKLSVTFWTKFNFREFFCIRVPYSNVRFFTIVFGFTLLPYAADNNLTTWQQYDPFS